MHIHMFHPRVRQNGLRGHFRQTQQYLTRLAVFVLSARMFLIRPTRHMRDSKNSSSLFISQDSEKIVLFLG